jgi:hypothetical protein
MINAASSISLGFTVFFLCRGERRLGTALRVAGLG